MIIQVGQGSWKIRAGHLGQPTRSCETGRHGLGPIFQAQEFPGPWCDRPDRPDREGKGSPRPRAPKRQVAPSQELQSARLRGAAGPGAVAQPLAPGGGCFRFRWVPGKKGGCGWQGVSKGVSLVAAMRFFFWPLCQRDAESNTIIFGGFLLHMCQD